jgi:hypothetical protein
LCVSGKAHLEKKGTQTVEERTFRAQRSGLLLAMLMGLAPGDSAVSRRVEATVLCLQGLSTPQLRNQES